MKVQLHNNVKVQLHMVDICYWEIKYAIPVDIYPI